MSFAIGAYVPNEPVDAADYIFEQKQVEMANPCPDTHIEKPLAEMYDPGDHFIEEFLDVELKGKNIDTRLHAEAVRLNGQYTHLPALEQARQRKISQLEINDEAEKEVEIALMHARRLAIQRSMNAQQKQMAE